ncbi:MAG: D-alanyl-D-alanine carboxypeptidase [Rhodobacteraceae bacterium]|nr:D-alanyl-D-alanine carboxypeptidase [Paracoccaceae bacterium]
MDARDGRVIFARNHDTRLHPASLTKMMTLYIAFEAVKHGEISLDTPVRISANAANTPCSCLGVRAGQTVALRYLIRAAALRSGNDAAVAIAEAISGSEAAFAQRMTRTARAMGMENTTFRNSHGLTAPGHLSTARDMTILGRQLLFDYPQYYNLFSRRSEHAGVGRVNNTNRALLDAYRGADGIKTGFTRAAGFNLTASAERGGVRIIATMFGGGSAAARNAHVAELLDIGFARAQTRVATRAPVTPAYQGERAVAQAGTSGTAANDRPSAGRTIRLQTAVTRSPRPQPRPLPEPPEELLLAVQQSVGNALAEQVAGEAEAPTEGVTPDTGLAVAAAAGVAAQAATDLAPAALDVIPPPRPETLIAEADPPGDDAMALARAEAAGFGTMSPEDFAATQGAEAAAGTQIAEGSETTPQAAAEVSPADPAGTMTTDAVAETAPPQVEVENVQLAAAAGIATPPAIAPEPRPAPATPASPPEPSAPAPSELIILTTAEEDASADLAQVAYVAESFAGGATPEIVSRLSTSSGRIWGVTLGSYPSRHDAERALIQTSLSEAVALENGLRRVRQAGGGFEASFAGLTRDEAEMACRRIAARQRTCFTVAP